MRTRALGAVAAVALLGVACSSGGGSSNATNRAPRTTAATATAPASTTPASGPAADQLVPPAVPASGSYLGAFVNGQNVDAAERVQQFDQVAPFEQDIGRTLDIDHHVRHFDERFPDDQMRDDVANGRIPMVSWACQYSDRDVAAGKYDDLIAARADDVKAFGQPIFIRWFWEMNDLEKSNHPLCTKGPADFVAAWQHVVDIFQQRGATNAAFVWCPGVGEQKADAAAFYPGDAYVSWIGVDIYQLSPHPKPFSPEFGDFYTEFAGHGKPLMIGETGANDPPAQQAWLDSVSAELPARYPDVKALVYWDAPGKGDYVLRRQGLASFTTLGADPYFNP